jgi:hypothetical protein
VMVLVENSRKPSLAARASAWMLCSSARSELRQLFDSRGRSISLNPGIHFTDPGTAECNALQTGVPP